MDQDGVFMSSLMKYLLKKFGIKFKNYSTLLLPTTTSRTWYKSMSTILTKIVSDLHQCGHKICH